MVQRSLPEYRPRDERYASFLRVNASTFGSMVPYHFLSLNISYRGLLLVAFSGVPFREKTILELEIELKREGLPENVLAVGKVVRFGHPGELARYQPLPVESARVSGVLGIQLTEVAEYYFKIWKDYIDALPKPPPASAP